MGEGEGERGWEEERERERERGNCHDAYINVYLAVCRSYQASFADT